MTFIYCVVKVSNLAQTKVVDTLPFQVYGLLQTWGKLAQIKLFLYCDSQYQDDLE